MYFQPPTSFIEGGTLTADRVSISLEKHFWAPVWRKYERSWKRSTDNLFPDRQ